jgi:hypothetical protein
MNARDPSYQLQHLRLHPFLFHPFLSVVVAQIRFLVRRQGLSHPAFVVG